ncbi:dialkylresorcinol condensing enzyme [Pasteurella skyensis]|uniref:Dialkylresorcinol condensing enzyme n=1 Tax=Phocoenobacter skyensis TaxID=97481 RepID=A0AAJ6NFC0_9PAST|nr:dialkylrecorsinol condensing enzyme [Pasteurella skyensis]MDP8171558.1 dialkylresorcinol condensing enzyme [Pasteurella skyensis]MDP8175763.1 dialkylresorcinol condensing enzyme [Pasteurella skyensis]
MQKTSKILVISYSQTGQLSDLVKNFVYPLEDNKLIELDNIVIEPQVPYPFPWKFIPFFNTFPESVHLKPAPIKKPSFQYEDYDLIIIAYTVWFLSPSQPITAFLQSDEAQKLLKDTPVITLIGCRNMWLMAQEKVKAMLSQSEATLIGNIVKVDQSNDWASFVTTPMWMLTGKKKPYAWLPSAGISESNITDMQRFGQKLLHTIEQNHPLDETLFKNMQAVKIDEKLMMSEKVGHRSFYFWGKLLLKCGTISPVLRQAVLYFYIIFLVILILTVVPISAIIKLLLKPIMKNKLEQQKAYYAKPSGE